MTDNMDEFEQDQFDPSEGPEEEVSAKKGPADILRNKAIIKLAVIVGVIGIAVAGALGAFSSKPEVVASKLTAPPDVQQAAPGGQASPYFIEQNKMANTRRVQEALQGSGSALPTPIGKSTDGIDLEGLNKKDPLVEFRAETERKLQEYRAEQEQNMRRMQVMQQQMQQQQAVGARQTQDDSLAQAMQRQMQQLMDSWSPHKMNVVNGVVPPESATKQASAAFSASTEQQAGTLPASVKSPEEKTIIPAGTVNYVQLLTEANSDVQGPIMVQILSGPFSGARAIGSFQTMYDYLVLTFNTVSYKGKEYAVNAIALNPDTTLGGMATEVDHRYFTRAVLPAAASFMQAFGSALGSGNSTTTVSGDTVLVNEAEKGYKDALYQGLGQFGQSIGQFFQQEAAQTKTLVRVAAGTPMGLFFLRSVKENGNTEAQTALGGLAGQQPMVQNLAGAGYLQGQQAYNPYSNPYGAAAAGVPGAAMTGYGAAPSSAYYNAQVPMGGATAYGASPYTATPGGTVRIYQGTRY